MTVDGRAALQLTAGVGRVEVAIILPSIGREVDVSAHPAAARSLLQQAARDRGRPLDAHEPAARAALASVAEQAGAWTAGDEAPLLAALGGASFPVLASAYQRGALPVAEIPRWAVPALRAETARAAAAAAFGTSITRPVVAALAGCLVHPDGGPVQLWRPAIGRMASQVLDPDRLARVLAADGPPRAEADVPDRHLIDQGRVLFHRWGAHRTAAVLLDACRDAEGPRLLAEAIRFGSDLGDHAPPRLPNRLRALHTLYRSRTATDPAPAAAPPPARPPARPPALPPATPLGVERATRIIERAFFPPPPPAPPRAAPAQRAAAAPGEPGRDTRLATPPTIRLLDGMDVGPLRIVVPRTCGDLQRWSRLLGNCLDTYGPAAARGDSTIIGVEREGSLRYAIELTRHGVVRQFLGAFNRAPDPGDRTAILRTLAARRVLDVAQPGNRAWLQAAD